MRGDGCAALRRARAFIPDDRQCVERRLRAPPGIGDDRNRGILHLYDAANTGTAGDLRFVIAMQLAAEYRTVLDCGAQHSRQFDVDRKDLAAVEFVGGIEPLHRLAGDLPVFRILQRDRLGVGRRQLGCRCGNLAVAGRTFGARVRDDAVGDFEFADRHLPLVCRRLQQHHASDRAAAAHVVVRRANAAAAASAHFTPHPLARQIGSRGDLVRL